MSCTSDFDLFVGGKTGVFKGIKVEKKGILVKNLQNIKILKPENEISVLRWDDENKNNVLIGTVDQNVKVYDGEFKAFSTLIETKQGTGPLVGVGRCNGSIVTCSQSGNVKVWKCKESEEITLEVGDFINCMQTVSHTPEIIATGGKNNDLKLWNLETKTKIFNARNVKKDMLELEVPIWVTDIKCIPDTEHQVVVSTKYGQVRLYDTRAQRRPIMNVELTNQNLNTLALYGNNLVITGSCTGFMLSVDLRGKGKVLHTYKGAVGSIRQVVSHPHKPYVASVGLDRYLRIHHIESRKLLHEKYLKVRLNCVVMMPTFGDNDSNPADIEKNSNEGELECIDLENSDQEYNDMFDKMETVKDGDEKEVYKSKRRKISRK